MIVCHQIRQPFKNIIFDLITTHTPTSAQLKISSPSDYSLCTFTYGKCPKFSLFPLNCVLFVVHLFLKYLME